MTTKATSTKGIKLQRGDGAGSETFTTIAEVTNIKGPSEKAAQLDATSFDSDAMEFIAGLVDAGDLTFDVNFVASDVQQQAAAHRPARRHEAQLQDDPRGSPDDPDDGHVRRDRHQAPELAGGVNSVLKGSGALKVSGSRGLVVRALS
jgi:hypothetical protein